ncbi:MAG TPA: hypothetical protein ENG16_03960 [Archaeoglobus sp.]|nr:hypothetical protein [Archaeoglobus sp.]
MNIDWRAILEIGLMVAVTLFATQWSKLKEKLHAFRRLVDTLDDAIADDKVTRDELKRIVERIKELLRW